MNNMDIHSMIQQREREFQPAKLKRALQAEEASKANQGVRSHRSSRLAISIGSLLAQIEAHLHGARPAPAPKPEPEIV